MKGNLFEGERIRLTAFTDEDVAPLASWLSDLGLQRLVNPGIVRPETEGSLADPMSWLSADRHNRDNFLWAVRLIADQTLIAISAMMMRDRIAGHYEIGINIGQADHQGQGYGREIVLTTMRYGFTQLNLNRISLSVFDYNTRAIRLYEKLGFVQEATLREKLYRDGVYYDELLMRMFKREWEVLYDNGQ